MSQAPLDRGRRAFLGDALVLGAGVLSLGNTARASTPLPATSTDGIQDLMATVSGMPSRVFVQHEEPRLDAMNREGGRFSTAAARVEFDIKDEGTAVKASCPKAPLSRVVVRWETAVPSDMLFLGDAWERGYGDLQWRFLQPERVMPWYFAGHREKSGGTFMAGVKTQPSALCFWTVDAAGISLWLDFRNGGSPSLPGDREIPAATIVTLSGMPGERPMQALRRFCRTMCPEPRLSREPVCGNNNWYYAYGRDFDANAMRRDAAFLAELASGHKVRPFCVIDAGWTPGGVCPGGPWTSGDASRFPDMPGLASDMKNMGVRPGIWMRPTALSTVDDPARLRAGPANAQEKPLDLTLPENLETIRADIARVCSWGYELIKHDFLTYDVFAEWGFQMGAQLTEGGWHFDDRTKTNAEIILRLYRTLREGAGDTLLLGCNTIGHLGAGLFEVQRTGDDTSGRSWERTRRMGVNTLAFRLPQHGTFFASDPDCAAHTANTPWEFDRQFLDLVARSGTALFVSVDPRTVSTEEKAAFKNAMQTALSGGAPGDTEPVDWLHTTAPREWRLGGEVVSYRWEEPAGAWPFRS